MKHYTIPVFIPELACPFRCVYCNQRKISGQLDIPSVEEVQKTVEEHLSTMDIENSEIEIGFFGGNFTGIPLEEQQAYLQSVQSYIKDGRVKSIRLSTRPDYIDDEILELLKKYHVSTIELGAQSLDDEVLRTVKRGHTAADVETAAERLLKSGFRLGLQMMIGLPGDTPEKSILTAKRIIELGAAETRIYPCLVIRGTELEQWHEEGKYTPLSLQAAVEQTASIIPLFEEAGVKILRIGLHPSEGLISGEELIAGPFHPSFKELVLTEIWKQLLQPHMKIHYRRRIRIHISPAELPFAIGHKSSNKNALKKYYDEVDFIADEKISGRKSFIEFM